MNLFHDFSIIWGKRAMREVLSINSSDRKRITDKVRELTGDVESLNIKKLKNHKHLFRIRIGNYRVIFESNPETKELFIARVGLRKSIYRNLKSAQA